MSIGTTKDNFDLMPRRKHDEIERLRAALEHIVRECGALNKGPVAVAIARAALAAGK
jgi:hypothetical protein